MGGVEGMIGRLRVGESCWANAEGSRQDISDTTGGDGAREWNLLFQMQ